MFTRYRSKIIHHLPTFGAINTQAMRVNNNGVCILPMAGAFLCWWSDPDNFIEVDSYDEAQKLAPIDFLR